MIGFRGEVASPVVGWTRPDLTVPIELTMEPAPHLRRQPFILAEQLRIHV
jgi:hypothetical protein